LRYSPSGKWIETGWSRPGPRWARICISALASAAAPATIFWKRSGPTAPEHENVSRWPPGASSFMAHRLMSLYARAALGTCFSVGANLGGSRTMRPKRRPWSRNFLNLFATPLTNPYDLNRYSGGYDAIFRDIAFYKSKTTLQGVELDHANVVLNTGYAGTFSLDNFNHIKVSEKSILSLANDPKYQSVYPLIDEVAIGRAPYYLLGSNWEYGFHHHYSTKSDFQPAAGTLRIGEDFSFVAKLVKLPSSIYLSNYTYNQVSINSLAGNYSQQEVAYQEDKTTVNGIINLANTGVRYISGTALADNIKETFVDASGNPITQSEEFLGNLNINDYIKAYVTDNLLNLYQIDTVEVWTLSVKSVTSTQAGTSGANPNTVQFVNLTDAQRASLGYALDKSVQINKLGDFLLGFSINKPTDASLSVSLNIKIALI